MWDAGNVGGQYTFVGNGPVTVGDPLGTQSRGLAERKVVETAARTVGGTALKEGAKRFAGPIGAALTFAELAYHAYRADQAKRGAQEAWRQADALAKRLDDFRKAQAIQRAAKAASASKAKTAPKPQLQPCPTKPDTATKKKDDDKPIPLYRGTDNLAELDSYGETGHLLSRVAQEGHLETGNLLTAYGHSAAVHQARIAQYGSERAYANAHIGNHLGGPSTFLSTTTSLAEAQSRTRDGNVFVAWVKPSWLLANTLQGNPGEQERLLRHGSKGLVFLPLKAK